MKNIVTILCLSLLLTACDSKKSDSDSSSQSTESTTSSSSSSSSSDPCEDMRSYDAGLDYGKNDKKGAEISGNSISTCDEVLQIYNDNYNQECFCTGFYKGQSEN
jgi:hypothetical protein